MKLRFRPAFVSEVLDHYDRRGWTETLREYDLHAGTLHRWIQQRNIEGPRWPTQADDDEWLAAQPKRRRDRLRTERYRQRSCYGTRRLWLDATGTRRRIHALHALGWRAQDIADRGPWTTKDAIHELTKRDRVTIANAHRIARIYEELCMRQGPSDAVRRRAARAGWLPPLAWMNIDDPTEDPAARMREEERWVRWWESRGYTDVDESVVQRILGGDWRLSCNASERAEVIAHWEGSLADLQRLTGWKVDRYITVREDAA